MSRVFEDVTPVSKAERNTNFIYDPPKTLIYGAMQKSYKYRDNRITKSV